MAMGMDYPVALQLAGWPVLVVGGGPIALGRIRGLLDASALVRVVASEAHPELHELAGQGRVTLALRPFQESDVAEVRLVFTATSSPEVNRAVVVAARARGILANAADVPALCDFTVPAVGRRGALTIAVTTGGQSPTAAKAARDAAMDALGPEYGELTSLLSRLRQRIPRAQRLESLRAIVDAGAARLLARGDRVALFGLVRRTLRLSRKSA
ncbi:MAG: precorrin-2 dehydrogenase/sirohydrochlorin ferrochelatase family protein [Deltaproteobacteria bacterium]